MIDKTILNPSGGGLSSTIKANYFKMGVRNFLIVKADGFNATGVFIEYD